MAIYKPKKGAFKTTTVNTNFSLVALNTINATRVIKIENHNSSKATKSIEIELQNENIDQDNSSVWGWVVAGLGTVGAMITGAIAMARRNVVPDIVDGRGADDQADVPPGHPPLNAQTGALVLYQPPIGAAAVVGLMVGGGCAGAAAVPAALHPAVLAFVAAALAIDFLVVEEDPQPRALIAPPGMEEVPHYDVFDPSMVDVIGAGAAQEQPAAGGGVEAEVQIDQEDIDALYAQIHHLHEQLHALQIQLSHERREDDYVQELRACVGRQAQEKTRLEHQLGRLEEELKYLTETEIPRLVRAAENARARERSAEGLFIKQQNANAELEGKVQELMARIAELEEELVGAAEIGQVLAQQNSVFREELEQHEGAAAAAGGQEEPQQQEDVETQTEQQPAVADAAVGPDHPVLAADAAVGPDVTEKPEDVLATPPPPHTPAGAGNIGGGAATPPPTVPHPYAPITPPHVGGGLMSPAHPDTAPHAAGGGYPYHLPPVTPPPAPVGGYQGVVPPMHLTTVEGRAMWQDATGKLYHPNELGHL